MFRLVQRERRSLVFTLVGVVLFFGGMMAVPDAGGAELADAPMASGVALCTAVMMAGGALWAVGIWPRQRATEPERADERLPRLAIPAVIGSGLALLVAFVIVSRHHL